MSTAVETVGSTVVCSYKARSGRMRYVAVRDAGDNGYSTASANPGCHTYQSRSLSDVVSYAIAHAPGVRTYASLPSIRRALARAMGAKAVSS